MIEKLFLRGRGTEKLYYKKFAPVIDWEWMLVLGIFLGSFISASLSGQFKIVWTPMKWMETFGDTPFLRWTSALVGGIIMGFGARWTGGCTSGHGISGTLQLAMSSWIATICFFIGGVATALFLFNL